MYTHTHALQTIVTHSYMHASRLRISSCMSYAGFSACACSHLRRVHLANTHTARHHIHVPHAYKPVTHMLLLTRLKVMWGPGTRPQAASWSYCCWDSCSGTYAQGWELWLSNVWLHKLRCSWLCLSLVYYSSLTEAPLQLTSRLSNLSCLGVLHETSTAQTPAALSSLRPTLKCLSATPIT